MSKRFNYCENLENTRIKVQKLQCDEIENPKLPIEMIIEIFSKLNEINDLRNCMLLSKEIRNSMFKSPKIMRKIQIVIKSDKFDKEFKTFLLERGKFIKNFKMHKNFYLPTSELIQNVLRCVPNLESFTGSLHSDRTAILDGFIRSNSDQSNDIIWPDPNEEVREKSIAENHFEFPYIKDLTLEIANDIFFMNAVNMKYLTYFRICTIESDISKALNNFLVQQENLKEFYFDPCTSFLTRDITSEVKFRLTKLEISYGTELNDECLKFIDSQAENLKELSFFDKPIDFEIDRIFKYKNLEKLTLSYIRDPDDNIDDILPNLKYFETSFINMSRFYFIIKSFPNLETLKCFRFYCDNDDTGNFKGQQIQNLKLSKLKNLSLSFVNSNNLEKFNSYAPYIENLKIMEISKISTLLSVIQNLKRFESLKTFETTICSKFLLMIKINLVEKTINVKSSILNQYKMASDTLQEIFKNFSFNLILLKNDGRSGSSDNE